MATHLKWESIPSIIFVDILSYLPMTDRINASSACNRWRSCLFHPCLWRRVKFSVTDGNHKRAEFLTDKCARYFRDVSFEFGTHCFSDVRETLKILKVLSENSDLEKLVLVPTSCQVQWPERDGSTWSQQFVQSIKDLIIRSRRLKHLSFGCLSEITEEMQDILPLLSELQCDTLQTLHISSVKENPESYLLIDLPHSALVSFANLTVLGIDYDYISNALLKDFIRCNKTSLSHLILHVHGLDPEQEKITNKTWQHLTAANSKFEVSLNLIHSIDGCENLLDILQPAMPLAHYRQFFCDFLNVVAVHFIAQHMARRLKSLVIVEGFDEHRCPYPYELVSDQDPFVMLAWRADLLEHITLIGFEFPSDHVMAIARLRGHSLRSLVIPACCMAEIVPAGEEEEVVYGNIGETFTKEISQNLGWTWSPMQDNELYAAVLESTEDAETVYLSLLQQDQQ